MGFVNAGFLSRIGLVVAPDLAMAVAFALSWWVPQMPGAAAPSECRFIMMLEGLSIVASAWVGIYLKISIIFFPLILAGCILWFIKTGTAGYSWLVFFFLGYVISALIDGIRAHRGYFGSARENPAHPHRRYDRMLILYLATSPILPIFWIIGDPLAWSVWGTIYFTLLAAVDTVLRDLFDQIPQGLLRRFKERVRANAAPKIGICLDCVHVQPAIPARLGRMIRCGLSTQDSRFPEYPATPLLRCKGFRSAPSRVQN